MLRSRAVSRMQERLGFRLDKAQTILDELIDAQERLERGVLLMTGGTFLPWFLVSEVATFIGTADEERIPLPDDFVSEDEEGAFWLYTATAEPDERWTPLPKDALNFLRMDQPGTGTPKKYAQLGDYFRTLPVPTEALTFKLIYRQKDAVLSSVSDTENRWLKYAPDVLMGEAGHDLAVSLRDKGAEDFFNKQFTRGAQRLFMDTERRSNISRRHVMGGED